MSEGVGFRSKVRLEIEGMVGRLGQRPASSVSPLVPTVLPQRPRDLHLVSSQPTELEVAWTPGLSGIYPLTHCTLQVRLRLCSPPPQSPFHLHLQASASLWETLSWPFVC